MKMVQAIANDLNACLVATPATLVATALNGVVTQFSATKLEFRYAVVMGKKDIAGTNNTGAIKIGISGSASNQPISIASNGEYVLAPPLGCKWNFQQFYFVPANDNDGIVVLYS